MTPRLTFVLALAASWVLALAFRLYHLQVLSYDEYAERAERQQQRMVVLDSPRGTIFDAHGRELAVSVEVESIAADPSHIADADATAEALAKILGLDRARTKKLTQDLHADREFVWIKRKIDRHLAEKIKALELPGVIFLPENKRYYPLHHLAAPVLGYVGTDGAGLAGLEFLYDRVVASEQGQRTVVRDARLGTVLYPFRDTDAAKPGRDLHLTLDATIQHLVERELESAVKKRHAAHGSIVVMEATSGAILAMASYPSFDPNRFAQSPAEHWRNQPVVDAYEPGSTFKMITLAAALEAGVVEIEDSIDCEMGGITLHRVHISDHHPFPVLSVRDVIAKSSNVGAIKLGLAAGPRRLYETIRAFGFGQRTGIDLPSESAGILRPVDRWSELTPAYVSFGQGLSVTSIQLVNAFAAIANGGRLLEPHVVAAIGGQDGSREIIGKREVVGSPISPSSVRRIREVLEGVVTTGTAKAAILPGYGAGGKTGTAQKAIQGGYAVDRHVASFVGFAPLHQPRVVCMVLIDEPRPAYHGGEVAAPIFQKVISRVLLYLGITPDRELPSVWPAESPKTAAVIAPPGEEAVDEPLPPGTVPDFTGLSARQVLARANGLGLRIAMSGHGIVRQQSPPPGTPLELTTGTLALRLGMETAL